MPARAVWLIETFREGRGQGGPVCEPRREAIGLEPVIGGGEIGRLRAGEHEGTRLGRLVGVMPAFLAESAAEKDDWRGAEGRAVITERDLKQDLCLRARRLATAVLDHGESGGIDRAPDRAGAGRVTRQPEQQRVRALGQKGAVSLQYER